MFFSCEYNERTLLITNLLLTGHALQIEGPKGKVPQNWMEISLEIIKVSVTNNFGNWKWLSKSPYLIPKPAVIEQKLPCYLFLFESEIQNSHVVKRTKNVQLFHWTPYSQTMTNLTRGQAGWCRTVITFDILSTASPILVKFNLCNKSSVSRVLRRNANLTRAPPESEFDKCSTRIRERFVSLLTDTSQIRFIRNF